MQLYNALSRSVEPFKPLGHTATVYVCGVTPYDTTHLGHAFTYVVFDTLIRYLEANGQPVKYTQNVTDIDDDILRKAKEVGLGWRELGQRETEAFLRDLKHLNVRMPDHYVYATEEVEMMHQIIEGILQAGRAYVNQGNVYFDVSADPDFGKLSRMDYTEMLTTANERGNVPDDPHKSDPLDFVLWQAAKPGEPTWESPWGPGRPGWHIECSAMSMRYLGEQIDIHGGGADLLFPHHEAEIAQSETYTGKKPFVQVWMHAAMVRMDGEKMSKSLGNMVFVRELVKQYTPDTIRFYLMSNHYRQAWEWHEAHMAQAAERMRTLTAALNHQSQGTPQLNAATEAATFHTAMQNDLDTPSALAALEALAARINHAASQQQGVSEAQATLRQLGEMIGFTWHTEGV